jgi:hypothetical protein
MHVLMTIGGGLLLLSVFILFGWLWGASVSGMALAGKCFLPTWLLIAVVNMWVGVNHAGYGLRDELPILLVVFIVPAIISVVLIWRLSHT